MSFNLEKKKSNISFRLKKNCIKIKHISQNINHEIDIYIVNSSQVNSENAKNKLKGKIQQVRVRTKKVKVKSNIPRSPVKYK